MNRAFWIHCTNKFHGDTFTAKRQTPILPARYEPDTPRLCVCRSIAGCVSARLFSRTHPLYVYQTKEKRSAVRPKNVWDAAITGEMWLVPPVEMKLVTTISEVTMAECQDAVDIFHNETGKYSDAKTRVSQLAICVRILENEKYGVHPSDKRVTEWALKMYQIDDPEAYLLSRSYAEQNTNWRIRYAYGE